jgi:hypothetical protein
VLKFLTPNFSTSVKSFVRDWNIPGKSRMLKYERFGPDISIFKTSLEKLRFGLDKPKTSHLISDDVGLMIPIKSITYGHRISLLILPTWARFWYLVQNVFVPFRSKGRNDSSKFSIAIQPIGSQALVKAAEYIGLLREILEGAQGTWFDGDLDRLRLERRPSGDDPGWKSGTEPV